jgi:malto-oligosyltrehalose trehalohydrolase
MITEIVTSPTTSAAPERSEPTFAFDLPCGAQVEDDGVRFRIWAPACQSLILRLTDSGDEFAMQPVGDGVFEVFTEAARTGTAYQYVLPDGTVVPDPASRMQADDVHGPSVVVDPRAYVWRTPDWRGRPWAETALYELHTGAFSNSGDFAGIERRLDELKSLGVTAVEIMPIADFRGKCGWGYDGVLPYAPERAYGTPEDLKRLVDAAHLRGTMIFLDVVYNHLGPDGNYLHAYAPGFFTDAHQTPWGAAIDFGRPRVRDFFLCNALYWLEEYRFDGLRLDAVHAIPAEFRDRFLTELVERVAPLRRDRHIHLVLENDANEAHFLGEGCFDAQWNDDIHHAFHVIATGERESYYEDYAEDPIADLGRALTEGFVYQGDPSEHRGGALRGESSAHLKPTCFVSFLQNHDQVGNRAMGERLAALTLPETLGALTTLHLLAPQIPLLFMGEEEAATSPFLFFCDFHDPLADAVREGRRKEFAKFPAFSGAGAQERIPDPNAGKTFESSRPAGGRPEHRALVQSLLALRQQHIVPLLKTDGHIHAGHQRHGPHGLSVQWSFGGFCLRLVANLGAAETAAPEALKGQVIAAWPHGFQPDGILPPWSVVWTLSEAAAP